VICEVSLPCRSLTAKRCCTKHKREINALRNEQLLSKSIRPYDYQAELSCTKVLRIAPLQLHKQKAAILVCVKITTNKLHCCIADAFPPRTSIIYDAKQATKKLRVCTFQLHCVVGTAILHCWMSDSYRRGANIHIKHYVCIHSKTFITQKNKSIHRCKP
jgi:hypothetical protein